MTMNTKLPAITWIITGVLIGVLLMTIMIFSIVPDRYESLVDAMDCDNVNTYLDDDAGSIVTELIEKKIEDCK